jgi:hypothetical protein
MFCIAVGRVNSVGRPSCQVTTVARDLAASSAATTIRPPSAWIRQWPSSPAGSSSTPGRRATGAKVRFDGESSATIRSEVTVMSLPFITAGSGLRPRPLTATTGKSSREMTLPRAVNRSSRRPDSNTEPPAAAKISVSNPSMVRDQSAVPSERLRAFTRI